MSFHRKVFSEKEFCLFISSSQFRQNQLPMKGSLLGKVLQNVGKEGLD